MSIDAADVEVLRQAIEWLRAGSAVDLVTVVKTWGSSPRPVGSIAAVRDDGVLIGSVSGGCVEKQLAESIRKKSSNAVQRHHIDDQQARRYGLVCGGNLELVFERLTQVDSLEQIMQLLNARKRVARTIDLGSMQAQVAEATPTQSFSYDENQVTQVFGPGWRALIIGAGQLSRFTAEFLQALEFEVLVCDSREHFRDAWSIASVPLINMSPDDAVTTYAVDANAAVLTLSHEPNLDDLALLEALSSEAFYVGALGSRGSHEKRVKRLAALGAEPADINKLHAPIGVSIGSRSSAEIAISIAAQLVQVRAQSLKTQLRVEV